jgi:hypothetical protein
MLIHISKRTEQITSIDGDIHILISVRPDGKFTLSGYLQGEWNTTYAQSDARVIDKVPALVSELQADLAARQASA